MEYENVKKMYKIVNYSLLVILAFVVAFALFSRDLVTILIAKDIGFYIVIILGILTIWVNSLTIHHNQAEIYKKLTKR